jgi:hypothetical protein
VVEDSGLFGCDNSVAVVVIPVILKEHSVSSSWVKQSKKEILYRLLNPSRNH